MHGWVVGWMGTWIDRQMDISILTLVHVHWFLGCNDCRRCRGTNILLVTEVIWISGVEYWLCSYKSSTRVLSSLLVLLQGVFIYMLFLKIKIKNKIKNWSLKTSLCLAVVWCYHVGVITWVLSKALGLADLNLQPGRRSLPAPLYLILEITSTRVTVWLYPSTNIDNMCPITWVHNSITLPSIPGSQVIPVLCNSVDE